MPEAIATTKRKFYKALDALTTTASQTSSHGNALAGTVSNKRPVSAAVAFDEARDRVRKRLRQSTSTTSLSTTPQISSTTSILPVASPSTIRQLAHGGAAASEKSPPNFSPWSHDAFISRLKTFSSVSRWHPKPEAISEVEWAKRGWSCVDLNTVACRGGCEKRVVVDLSASTQLIRSPGTEPDQEDEDDATALEEAFVERYKAEIINGHAESCLWHKAGCKDDIYRLQVVRPSVWQPELGNRFQSLLKIGDSVAGIRFAAMEMNDPKFAPISQLINGLPEHVLGNFETTSQSETALQIALHGWRGSSEAGNQLLICDACFQRIGLWMYQPDYRPSTRGSKLASDEDDEPDDQSRVVDLGNMHREHCPWRNPNTQQAIGSLSGLNACQVLQRVAATCVRDHRRRISERTSTFDEGLDNQREMEEDEDPTIGESPRPSREEIAAQDKERESRLRKLKNLFNIKRKTILHVKPGKKTST